MIKKIENLITKNMQTLQVEGSGRDDAAGLNKPDGQAPLSHAAISSLALLEDASSVSQSMFGSFLPSLRSDDSQQLLIVRANQTIELYQVNQKVNGMRLICKYSSRGAFKLSKVIKVPRYSYNGKQCTWKDLVVAQISPLKFVTLEVDEDLQEFAIVCMHNFQGDLRLQESGLAHPREGFLQSFCAKAEGVKEMSHGKRVDEDAQADYDEYMTGFVFLADHCKLVIVQFKMGQVNGIDTTSGGNLTAEYLDVSVPRRQTLKGTIIAPSAESLLYPTQVVDLLRQQPLPNPLHLYQRYQKDSSSMQDAFGNRVRDGPTMIDGEQHLDNLIADMDAVLQQHLLAATPAMHQSPTPRTVLEAETYVKQSHAQHPELRLVSIRDLRICASASPTATTVQTSASPLDRNSLAPRVSLSLLVLHQVHQDKCAGTDSKVPSFNVNIYDVSLMRSQYYLGASNKQPRALTKDASCVINLRESIQRLNHYTKSIIANEAHDFGQASCSLPTSQVWRNDLIYFISNTSIYAYRLERNKLTEVQTSSLCTIVDNLVANERRDEKRMPPADQQAFPIVSDGTTIKLKHPCRVQSMINHSDMELRYDGCTRFHALPNNRLLVISENKDGKNLEPYKYVFHFRFDQGDLDIIAVECVKIRDAVPSGITETQPYLVPSCLAVQVLIDEQERADLDEILNNNRNSLTYMLSVSSYCHDQQILQLKANFEAEEVAGAAPEKRQRLMSSDSGLATQTGVRRQSKNPVPQSYSLEVCSCLTTLAPITNLLELPTDSESLDSSNSDLLISCGPKENSQLRLLYNPLQHGLAMHERQKLLDMEDLSEVFTLFYPSNESQPQATQFVILSKGTDDGLGSTHVLEFGDRLAEIEYHADDSEGFRVCQQGESQGKGRTTSVAQTGDLVVQVVAYRQIRVLQYAANRFRKLSDFELDGAHVLEVNTSQRLIYLLGRQSLFILDLNDSGNIKLEPLDLPEKIQDSSSPSSDKVVLLTVTNKVIVLTKEDSVKLGSNFITCKPLGITFRVDMYADAHLNLQPALVAGNILESGQKVVSYATDVTQGLSLEPDAEEERKSQESLVNRIDRFSDSKLKLEILQIKAKVFESAPNDLWLFVLMRFGRLAVYRGVDGASGLVFKLLSCPVLDKLQNHNIDCTKVSIKMNVIHDDGQQLFVLFRKMNQQAALKTSCLVITAAAEASGGGSGKLLFNQLQEQDERRVSQAKLAKIVKGVAKSDQMSPVFLAVETASYSQDNQATLVRVHRPPLQLMDLRSTQVGGPICNGVTIKSFAPPNHRGIKSFCIHRGKFLVVASFRLVPTKNTPADHIIRQGFNPNAGNMAQDYSYQIEVYQLPSMYHKGRNKAMKKNWKELLNFQKALTTFAQFTDDEVVTSVESIELEVQGAQDYNQNRRAKRAAIQQQMGMSGDLNGFKDIATRDDFLVISTIKLEQKLDKVHYPSSLYIFQMIDTTDEAGNISGSQLILLRKSDQQKRLINCLRPFRGHLISVQNVKQDYQIKLQQLRIKPLTEDEAPYNITGVTPPPDQQFDISAFNMHPQYPILGIQYHLDSAQTFPQSIQSLARFINIEQDEFILIGDVYKSFQVFNPKTAVELDIDHVDKSRISLKKRFQCKMDASCIAVFICEMLPAKKSSVTDPAVDHQFTMQRDQAMVQVNKDASYDLKDCSFMAASQDGTLRMYKVRDQKTMECVAQGNVADNILSVHPFKFSQRTDGDDKIIRRKQFLVVPRRGSFIEVRQVTFMYWLKIKQIAEVMSQILPFPFGVPPALAMPGLTATCDQGAQFALREADTSFQVASKHLGALPSSCLLMCSRSLRAQAEVAERFEQGSRLPQEQLDRLQMAGAASSAFFTENNFVDVRLVKSQLLSLEYSMQRFIAHECGFKSLQDLWQLLEQTN